MKVIENTAQLKWTVKFINSVFSLRFSGKAKAISAMQTRLLIDLIDKAVVRVREYPDNGGVYYSIIDLKYMNYFKYSEDEILEELNLERSTYYRKKKEATVLLGYILFGFVMPEYVKKEKSQNNETELRPFCY